MARWEGIYEFVQVVEAGSFSGAAQRMGVANSQVSKRVARLEDRLGTRLLNRTTRRLTLTDEGEMFYHRCRQTIEAFESAEQDIASHQQEPRGTLKLSVAASLPEQFVVPLLDEFLRDYSRINIDADFSGRRADLVSRGYDLAIWQGELKDSSLIARKLTDNRFCLVAHPDYLAAHGRPASPDDLPQHYCLGGSDGIWRLSDGNDLRELKTNGHFSSGSRQALLAAACNAQGIVQLPYYTAYQALRRGELEEVLRPWNKLAERVWVVYPQSKHVAAKVRLLISFLITRLETPPGLEPRR